jgi:hypothetical protein
MTLKGNQLKPSVRAEVLRRYVHRYTGEHKPQWAGREWKDGKPYPLHFKDDNDWLANTEFEVTKAGELNQKFHQCVSSPTWPNNPELR